ncbi:hypothetical protein QJS10_CPA07g00595 [Acorus calamus]|uniref:MULE transposase domain-containing protein n=1 Tax=Acorus calamus TaxID=4465 RepID=A0AAV9EHB2_ACOCL|nr:hypothetical protein QJS10_CPA07g00595 [Acorus calamus]
MNGNSVLFTVAFAVVEGENESSWHWFLECMHEAIGEMPKQDPLFIALIHPDENHDENEP